VVAEAGDRDAERTLVFVAHHDAAHGGLVFAPQLTTVPADAFPGWYERQETSPQVMVLVVAGPALVALGAVLGSSRLRRLGSVLSLGSAAAFADIASRAVVPGANDNLSGVAVLVELAQALRSRPVSGVRVLLVSTGSEESFMEGMRGFARRHFGSLPKETTEVVCLDSVGSPELILIEGEGMLRMRDYTPELRDRIGALAAQAGVHLRRGLRLGLATDGLIALKAGYRSAALGSVTRYKLPLNYHNHRDVPAALHYDTIADAATLCEALIRT
jgi:putative aminopeptidase FrvX